MTLKEIAKEAGVAPSTVSRILSNKGPSPAGKEVRDRVLEIVRRTGYVPNSSARSLRAGSAIESEDELYLACMYARSPSALADPFFSSIARHIDEEAHRHNYSLRYSFTARDNIHSLFHNDPRSSQLQGIAVLGRCDKQLLRDLKSSFQYVIYTGLVSIDANYDQVICDGYAASQMAVNYLVKLGHRNIAYIGETINEIRFNGFLQAVRDHNLPENSKQVENRIVSAEGGYIGAKSLLSRAPEITAIFCANDQTALGAIKAVHESGLRIPQDISIIGIDDIEESEYMVPRLTTIHIPTAEMGEMTTKVLIDRIEGGHTIPVKLTLPCHLVERESCSGPRKSV